MWLEASLQQFEAASALAHVAVARHSFSATLWRQWVEIEGLRTGADQTQLRLRAMASAAGVKLA